MKKMYKSLRFFIVVMSLAAMKLGAQPLNGAYTINNGQSTGGTNFASFTAFANALNSNGVSGPVTVNVSGGPYNEQPAFNSISGASATNSITINGNNCLITFASNSSSAAWTILLNGADHMKFHNLQMQNTGSTYAIPCYLTGGADYNLFSSCTFSCNANGTSQYNIAVLLSASATSPLSTGSNSGNYNTWRDCQMFSGYYGVLAYGLTSAPYQQGNTFIGNQIRDFYVYGMYIYYQRDVYAGDNIAERPTRTTLSTFYGINMYYCQNSVCEGNIVQKGFEQNPSYSATCYSYYWYSPHSKTTLIGKNTYRNNIVRNMRCNGTIYGAYAYYASGDIYHNTFSLDDQNAGGSATVYGIMTYGNSSYEDFSIKNNMISVTRSSSGTRYGIYSSIAHGGITIEGNNVYVNSPSATNYHGYWAGTVNTFANWQSLGHDANGLNLNPNFVNILTDVHPQNVALNNMGLPLGLQFDQEKAVRNPTTPDMGALEFLTPLCSGTPSSGIAGPNYSLCPGETAFFNVNNLSSDNGITYAWQTSTISTVGPWTPLTGTTITQEVNNVTQKMWVSVVVTCSNGGGQNTAVHQVNIAGPTVGSVPYYEDFENIGLNNRAPNCSWTVPNMGGTAKTFVSSQSGNRLPNSGSSFATFENTAPVNYYYTHPMQMEPGITYSASLWYQTDMTGATNWSDLSIMIGTAQNPSGLTTIASSNGPAVSPVYKGLGNTFTVAASGLYYVAVKAASGSGAANYLSWDDLRIEIPCSENVNPVALTIAAPNTTICSGTGIVLTAAGANTYTWNTGASTAVMSNTPVVNPTLFEVTGTNTLTGCSASKTQMIHLKQSPVISVNAFPPVSCAGKPIILSAGGANIYSWNTGQSGAIITVTANAPATYTVIGTNAQNCSTDAVVSVFVNSNPNITANAPSQICVGETATLVAAGAVNYQWSSNTGFILTNPAYVTPQAGTITYTVTGTDNNGCQGTQMVSMAVDACTGISETSMNSNVHVYPNPTSGLLTVELASGSEGTVVVMDLAGRVLASSAINDSKTSVDLNGFAAGVYYVKVSTSSVTEMIKVIRN